ncbi:MAG: thiamine pyrophosphate-dependent dehydrogenase E1 component subunit alpha [Acidimicrobiia bacterium]
MSSVKSSSTKNSKQADELPDKDLCRRLFEGMVLMRATEDRLVALYRQGELPGSVYTGHGHEAIAVGTAAALRPDDVMAPLHRDIGAHLWRGLAPWEAMATFMGKATGPTGGRDGALHYGRLDLNIINPISMIPDNYPVATGAAFAAKYRGTDALAIAYCGDGSTSRGDFHEALNIASVLKLPVIFVIENNQFAYSTPLSQQTATEDFACKAAAYAMPGERHDGNDVIAVYGATSRAVERARAGDGPTLLEFVTMRMHGHAEHDSADYVPKGLIEDWAKKDPIERFEKRLLEAHALDADDVTSIKDAARKRVLEDAAKARKDPMPDPATVEEGVYAD